MHQQVHVQFGLLQETLYMAIYLIDRYLNKAHMAGIGIKLKLKQTESDVI